MAKKTCYMVDEKKMRLALAKTGETMAAISQKIGFSDGYLSGILTEKKIPSHAALLLELSYGISPAMYAPTDTEPAPCEPEQVTVDDLTQKQVEAVSIQEEVTQGIVNAALILMESKPFKANLQQMLYSALRGALMQLQNEQVIRKGGDKK